MKSSDPIRPSSRRGASGAWNRLKPVREDVLESYGLPSKGETRYSLNSFPFSCCRTPDNMQAQRHENTGDFLKPHN